MYLNVSLHYCYTNTETGHNLFLEVTTYLTSQRFLDLHFSLIFSFLLFLATITYSLPSFCGWNFIYKFGYRGGCFLKKKKNNDVTTFIPWSSKNCSAFGLEVWYLVFIYVAEGTGSRRQKRIFGRIRLEQNGNILISVDLRPIVWSEGLSFILASTFL